MSRREPAVLLLLFEIFIMLQLKNYVYAWLPSLALEYTALENL